MAQPMTAPQERARGLDANARGIVILVIAVAIGLLLLWKAGPDGTTTVSSGSPSTTVDAGTEGDPSSTTTAPGASTTAPENKGRPPGEVTVIVLNGSGKAGVAGTNTLTIGAAGYKMAGPANANAQIDKTAVYYATDYQDEATAVAAVLGKPADSVAALPAPAPGPGADKANVVVVLGKETPAAEGGGGASTTTTAAG